MAYETLSTSELQKELLRRTTNMESWTNDVNLAKARADVKDELEKGAAANAKASDEISSLKKKKLFKPLASIFGLFAFIAFIVFLTRVFDINSLPNDLKSNPDINRPAALVSVALTAIFSILYVIFNNVNNKGFKIIHTPGLVESEDHQKRSEMLYWYLMLMNETDSKMLYRKVYKDTFAVVNELCKDPKMKKKVEDIKKKLGIDFSYVDEKLKAAEERVREDGIDPEDIE